MVDDSAREVCGRESRRPSTESRCAPLLSSVKRHALHWVFFGTRCTERARRRRVTGSLLGVVEIESLESTGFEGEKGEYRWRRARVDVEIGRC